ncbi:MAG: response regulator transcription factor [Candidatus Acidiferrum sp.]
MERVKNWIRILVADESESVRHRVASILASQPGAYLVEEAGSEQELLAKLSHQKPQVVIGDVAQSSLGGLNLMRKVREYCPDTRMIVLSQDAEEQLVRGALAIGVCSYVLKSQLENKIALAVVAASVGLCLFDRDVAEIVAKGYLENPATTIELPTISSRLTARELEIVRLLTLGSGNRQIAVKLGIRLRTVESHRANVMRKLNVHTLTELIHLAVREGIIHIPSAHSRVAIASSSGS